MSRLDRLDRCRGLSPAAVRSRGRWLLSLLVLFGGGCWEGWTEIFDPTPSREHRVEDLRVLAIVSEPASIVVPPAIFFDEENAAPINLVVTPEIYDPRGGGDIAMRIALCATRDPFLPCESVAIPFFEQTLTADADNVLGRIDNLSVNVALGPEAVRALYRDVGLEAPVLHAVTVDVVVEVSRKVGQIFGRERAVLPLEMRLDVFDPSMPSDALDALLAQFNTSLCAPDNTSCFQDAPIEPECGNGVVEPGESCEPPGADGCDEFCFDENDFCGFVEQPPCVPPMLPNQRPLLTGIAIVDDPFTFVDTPDIERGGDIEVPAGASVFVLPIPAVPESAESPQLLAGFIDPTCPPDSPAGSTRLQCGATDFLSFRFYIADKNAELTFPTDDVGNYIGNDGFTATAAGVAFTAGTAPGTREPLVIVAADGRGGMDVATFTLVAR